MSGTTTGSSGGFLSRLDDASTTLRAERKDITPIKGKAEGSGRQSSKGSPSPTPALDQHACPDSSADSKHKYKCEDELHTAEGKGGPKSENDDLDSKREKSGDSVEKGKALDSDRDSEGEGEGEQDLVSQCNEYIFDLFDANMLEDYHTVANFETRALEAFVDPFSEEISFEQERLHK